MIPFYQSRSNYVQSLYTSSLSSFPLHLHDELEIKYIVQGTLTLHYAEKHYRMQKGDLCIIFPHEIQGYTVEPDTAAACVMTICNPDFAGVFKSQILSGQVQMPVLSHADRIRNVVDSLYELSVLCSPERNETTRNSDENINLAKSLIQLILARTLPKLTVSASCTHHKNRILPQLLSYLTEHYRNEVSLVSTAEALNVTPGYISRIFSEQLHMSFVTYLHHLRIECAKNLLANTNLSILEISLQSGFENLRSFNRVFKAVENCTPTEYRSLILSK